ncbi:putative transcription factor interactor and regulator CCHC(Zn) family [Lupinus albus]|uniref:Putative transcription factor interactor and regulator CCHC(Zn) family n=1 Tax=Lupinus albus TaxID=3870 RepID=A0A6A4QFU4_LUPAL|nr:putative transcription factor interactor and regulator CCHC(Zn) family [Lupinus albus]
MKMDCPKIKKSSFKGKNGRRAYIAWEDNDTSSASEPESEEQTHLSLMASHHSDDEEVNESIPFYSSELQTAFNDLHDEYMKLSKMFLKQKSEIDSLRNIPSSSSCLNCITLGNKVSTLSLELNKMNKSSKSLSKIINDQRHSTDRRGLGYGKGPTLKKHINSIITDFRKTCFHASTHTKYKSRIHMHQPICSYCKNYGHTPNTCSIRKYGVPLGYFIWVEKGSNNVGPKTSWVPNIT